MKDKKKVYNFLKLNGFELIEEETSAYFGDYYNVFTNDTFKLMFSSSKSLESVDIQSNISGETWYDLALVKVLLYNEKELTNPTNIEEYCIFLQRDLSRIIELFNKENYSTTKMRLDKLENERAEQMFPGVRK